MRENRPSGSMSGMWKQSTALRPPEKRIETEQSNGFGLSSTVTPSDSSGAMSVGEVRAKFSHSGEVKFRYLPAPRRCAGGSVTLVDRRGLPLLFRRGSQK